uniref:Beta-fructofuranosidase, insoluble isoenzyme CWINV4 n=1 Tax=Litchi chinensis TaxID=151069 RepID=A0A248XBI5_LITCN|nr:beta-fructofuranosidase, insoluble isoenzyme CWINV4 [Litchi chinensis]
MTNFSVTLILLFSLLLSHGIIELEASTNQPYRTGFHFQPAKNWMNDPNGPMIYRGIYHLFYQYNPYAAVWGNITWAHSTSTDLINWTPHDIALAPSAPFDSHGCYSGSATIRPGGRPAIFYTGSIDSFTNQVQNLAVPKNYSDPYLREWLKYTYNPLISATRPIDATSFRDPSTAWLGPDKRWRMLIGSVIDNKGSAILYTSKDFKHWIKVEQPFYSDAKTKMWECPDFYPVSTVYQKGVDTSIYGPNIKHVLKTSLNEPQRDCYMIGTYDIGQNKFIPDPESSLSGDSGLRYDYGKFYASKSFFDSAKNRRILWAWVPESSSEEDNKKKGWAGLQAIPRSLWLEKSGKQLVQWPAVEIESLRLNEVKLQNRFLQGGSVLEVSGITAAQADVEILFDVIELDRAEVLDPSWTNPQVLCSRKSALVKSALGPFGLLVLASKGLEEQTAVFFRIFKGQDKHVVLMCSDQSRSSLDNTNDRPTYGAFLNVDPVQERLSLRSLIDHSIVESFGGGGKTCITARAYPTLAIDGDAHLYAFNYGIEGVSISNLSAWSMKKAQIN